MTGPVYLAYAEEDREAVRDLHARLKQAGFTPWLDDFDILPGQERSTAIDQAITSAAAVLACLSSKTVGKAGALHRQLRQALSTSANKPPGDIYLIPVRLDACALPDHRFGDLGLTLTDLQAADLFEGAGFSKLVDALSTVVKVTPRLPLQGPSTCYRAPLLESFDRLCQAAENAVAANQKPAARDLLTSLQSWQMSLTDALDDAEFLAALPQYLADRETDIEHNLLGHYFDRNPAAEILSLLNKLPKGPGPLIDPGDEDDLRSTLLRAIDDVLAKIREGTSGLDPDQARTSKRALIIIRGEITAPRYNPDTLSQQRAALEGIQLRLVERPRLLTEALLGSGFPNLPAGTVFRYVPELWCPPFVMIPAGTFLMGSPADEPERHHDEGPQHQITPSQGFALGRYAVTFDAYDHFCEATGWERPGDEGWGRDRRPVIHVSDDDAVAYGAWLSEATGGRVQLPTEAQWEYACRAGTTTPFSFGSTITIHQANYNGNLAYAGGAKGASRGQTVPVGSLPANPWGLHEMHGNVREWCADTWHGTYEGAPTDGRAWIDDQSPDRVVRGGSWNDFTRHVRSAYRFRYDPGARHDNLGFRCAGVQEES